MLVKALVLVVAIGIDGWDFATTLAGELVTTLVWLLIVTTESLLSDHFKATIEPLNVQEIFWGKLCIWNFYC